MWRSGEFGLGCLDFHSSGICGNGVCFCKAPYSGETCESEFKAATLDDWCMIDATSSICQSFDAIGARSCAPMAKQIPLRNARKSTCVWASSLLWWFSQCPWLVCSRSSWAALPLIRLARSLDVKSVFQQSTDCKCSACQNDRAAYGRYQWSWASLLLTSCGVSHVQSGALRVLSRSEMLSFFSQVIL